jgi:toxin ParE1/3/4
VLAVKPVIPRSQADRDVRQALEYYLGQGALGAATKFIAALEAAYTQIARQPQAGSPRYGHELNLPGLRFVPLHGFPHLVFYVEREDHVDIWRVLHGQRDVPSWMQDAD